MSFKLQILEEETRLLERLKIIRQLKKLYSKNNEVRVGAIELIDVKDYVVEKELSKRTRKHYVVHQRMYLSVYIKQKFNISYEEIGTILGVTHDVITHYVRTHEKKYSTETRYMANVSALCQLFPF